LEIDFAPATIAAAAPEKFPRGVFAFATPPPLAKFARGNFLAPI
jgi:hypothetical protein